MVDERRVAVIGGGIAGLTAAHELIARGFQVQVIEKRGTGDEDVGGKAASQYPAHGGSRLLGEHGFRFFPSFYETIFETMDRIPRRPEAADPARPLEPLPDSVRSSLRPVEQFGIARAHTRLARVPRDVPRIDDVGDLARALSVVLRDVPGWDMLQLASKLLHYFTRGPRERLRVHEKLSFWDFVDGDALDPATQRVLRYLPKSLVAMSPKRGNARTLLDLFWLMLVDFGRDRPSDLVLPGPTTDTFIGPWRRWLERLGVRFVKGEVASFRLLDGRAVAFDAAGTRLEADTYFLTTPLEATQPILKASGALTDECAILRGVAGIDESALGWMVGAQLFLRREPAALGHLSFPDSKLALTAIVQSRHWDEPYREHLRRLGIRSVLSVIATEWDAEVFDGGRSGRQLTRAQIFREIERELADCRDDASQPLLESGDVVARHLDESVVLSPGSEAVNLSPLLVHPPGLWGQRPTPWTEIPNLFLAGDYVRSGIDLATMEGANASAREAVNAFLAQAQRPPWGRCFVRSDYLAVNTPPLLRAIQAVNDNRLDAEGPRAPLVRALAPDAAAPADGPAGPMTHEEATRELMRLAPIIARH